MQSYILQTKTFILVSFDDSTETPCKTLLTNAKSLFQTLTSVWQIRTFAEVLESSKSLVVRHPRSRNILRIRKSL